MTPEEYEIIEHGPPEFSYIRNANLFAVDEIDEAMKEMKGYDVNKSMDENMKLLNIFKIYDCGWIRLKNKYVQ